MGHCFSKNRADGSFSTDKDKYRTHVPFFCQVLTSLLCRRARDEAAESPFDRLSHEEVLRLFHSPDFIHQGVGAPGPDGEQGSVSLICPDTVVKCILTTTVHEPYTMALVSSQTTIRIPKVRRHFFLEETLCLFMEYVEGDDLEDVWPTLSIWRKLWIVWTLRSYIRQLRRVQLPNPNIPGPMDGSGTPLRCKGRYFTDIGAGPFMSYGALASWFRRRLQITLEVEPKNVASSTMPSFDDSMPLVLTHGDISMRNVRLGKDGTVWLLDWDWAGVYPKWFDYAGIVAYKDREATPALWLALAPVMAGWYNSQYAFLKRIALGIFYFAME